MFAKVLQFIWNHFWKMVSAASWLFVLWFVDSVQQPEKVQATIAQHTQDIAFLKDDNLQLKISLGTNNQLFTSIDGKLTKLMENQAVLSQEVKSLTKR